MKGILGLVAGMTALGGVGWLCWAVYSQGQKGLAIGVGALGLVVARAVLLEARDNLRRARPGPRKLREVDYQ